MFGAGALLLAGATTARAAPASVNSWMSYEQRLTARLDDAGGGRFDEGFAAELLDETNRFRAAQGLAPLIWDEGLAKCARAHVGDLVARRYFAHESPEGFTHVDRVSLLNRDLCSQTAENLAFRDYPTQRTVPAQFETMWENSPGHRQNLLNGEFVQAGYGVVKIGSTLYAAGLYGDEGVRLGHALPLNLNRSNDVTSAVEGAFPVIDRLSLTAPFQHPTSMVSASEAMPPLMPGVWQLRPLRFRGGTKYDVLMGPLFHLG